MVRGHDRNVRTRLFFSFSNVSGGLQAVHLRHLNVHQNDVELPGLIALLKVHRFLSVVRARHRVPLFLEKLLRPIFQFWFVEEVGDHSSMVAARSE
jgi:hypothetical protein